MKADRRGAGTRLDPTGAISPTPRLASLVDRGLAQFRQALRDRSLKMSTVREAIARAALGCDGHFSVDELLHVLQAKGVREAHMATIYRAMPLMVEAGLIQQAPIREGDGQRYEVAFERAHHDHLVCSSCGRVIEYRSQPLEALRREIAERHDFELDGHVHVLRGRCKDCRRATARHRGRA